MATEVFNRKNRNVAERFGNGLKTADTCSAINSAIMATGLMNADISDSVKRKLKRLLSACYFKPERIF